MQESQGVDMNPNPLTAFRLRDPQRQGAERSTASDGKCRVNCAPASNLGAGARRLSVLASIFTLAASRILAMCTVRGRNHALPRGHIVSSPS